MPDGKGTLGNLPGKVSAVNGLQTKRVSVTLPLGPRTPIMQLIAAVDANNKLLITTG